MAFEYNMKEDKTQQEIEDTLNAELDRATEQLIKDQMNMKISFIVLHVLITIHIIILLYLVLKV